MEDLVEKISTNEMKPKEYLLRYRNKEYTWINTIVLVNLNLY